ncbi:MAG: hypothetical protein H6742_07975 [Alphaproteobacteria bacterium]|nr:hypothetical protein [Alphaproteobacteria bacterium]
MNRGLLLLALLGACGDKDPGEDGGGVAKDSGGGDDGPGPDSGGPTDDGADSGVDSGGPTDDGVDSGATGGEDSGATGGEDSGDAPLPLTLHTSLGAITAADPALSDPGILTPPNLDDDDGDTRPDWLSADGADDDGATVTVQSEHDVALTLSGETARLRVWADGALLLDDSHRSATLPAAPDGVVLRIEAAAYRVTGSLSLDDGIDHLDVAITGTPLLLNHHLQPSTEVLAVAVDFWGLDNSAMIDGYTDALGPAFTPVSGIRYLDIWLQDEIEFATATTPDTRLDVVIDSIRDGQYGPGEGLDPVAEDLYLGPGWSVGVWGSGLGNAQDYFGNLEVSPPVTVDGVDYPFGRIYYGRSGRSAPHRDLLDFLDEQAVQAPFELDVSFLCVGHVDEFLTFVPDPGSERGFKLLYTDTATAWAVIDGMDPATRMPRYARSAYKDWDTVGDLQDDAHLRLMNQELQSDYLDPNLDTLKEALGLTDDDIVRVPGLFETVAGCGGTTAAAFPGMVNLIVADTADGTALFTPDPYLRSDLEDAGGDDVAAAFEAAVPDGLEVVWLDDFETYHLNLGEVHCGSNVVRDPPDDVSWWDDAAHLLE